MALAGRRTPCGHTARDQPPRKHSASGVSGWRSGVNDGVCSGSTLVRRAHWLNKSAASKQSSAQKKPQGGPAPSANGTERNGTDAADGQTRGH